MAYSKLNYFELAKKGISKAYVQKVLGFTQLSVSELIGILPISIDTYKRKTVFNSQVTEKVLEVEEVYEKGMQSFGNAFYDWMDTINPALGSIKPKVLLTNSFGIRRLLSEIGRIEHGVLA